MKGGPKDIAYHIYAMYLNPDGNKVNPTSAHCVVKSIQDLNLRLNTHVKFIFEL